jgi:hypothetical protein
LCLPNGGAKSGTSLPGKKRLRVITKWHLFFIKENASMYPKFLTLINNIFSTELNYPMASACPCNKKQSYVSHHVLSISVLQSQHTVEL